MADNNDSTDSQSSTADANNAWYTMMTDWQKTQASMTQKMLDNMEQWSKSINTVEEVSSNPLLDFYQSLIKPYSGNDTLFNNPQMSDYFKNMPGSGRLIQKINELTQGGKAIVEKMQQDFVAQLPDDGTRDYFSKTLSDLSNPYNWLNYTNTTFDEGVQKFSEGPIFSGISDIENRISKATDGWVDLCKENTEYYEILLKIWSKAYERFTHQLEATSHKGESISPRQLVEIWSTIANEEMMVMHRSEEFLTVQKKLIKAGAEYRLYEREVAEVICEATHIPTRREIDDLHKTITELKRDVRWLKKQLTVANDKAEKNIDPSVTTKKAKPKAKKKPAKES